MNARMALAAVLAAGLLWLYAGIVSGLVIQWITSPDASYGAIVAAVAVAILWRRRHRIRTRFDGSAPWPGALMLALGLAAYLVGDVSADLFTTRVSLIAVLGGLLWFLGGLGAARTALAPLFFLLIAIPLPEMIVTTLTSSLQTIAARTAETTLTLGGIAVYREGNVLQLPATTLQIAEACSGLRSVVSLASVGVLLAWALEGPMERRVLLAASTVPIAVVANGLRVAATGAAAEAWGPAMARDPWHTLAGWLTFVVSLALVWVVQRALLGGRPPAPYIENGPVLVREARA